MSIFRIFKAAKHAFSRVYTAASAQYVVAKRFFFGPKTPIVNRIYKMIWGYNFTDEKELLTDELIRVRSRKNTLNELAMMDEVARDLDLFDQVTDGILAEADRESVLESSIEVINKHAPVERCSVGTVKFSLFGAKTRPAVDTSSVYHILSRLSCEDKKTIAELSESELISFEYELDYDIKHTPRRIGAMIQRNPDDKRIALLSDDYQKLLDMRTFITELKRARADVKSHEVEVKRYSDNLANLATCRGVSPSIMRKLVLKNSYMIKRHHGMIEQVHGVFPYLRAEQRPRHVASAA